MSKSISPSATVGEDRVYPLRTGKIRLTKATASEINRAVGVRPSEARFAERLIRFVINPDADKSQVSASPKTATDKSAVKKKPSPSSK
jgi:hypothetical protein